jgi:hypothetical protein
MEILKKRSATELKLLIVVMRERFILQYQFSRAMIKLWTFSIKL